MTGSGLRYLGALPLVQLSLKGTGVDDAGLAGLKDLPAINSLNLDNTQVSDTGFGYLKGLKTLRFLYVRNTKITVEGIKQFNQSVDFRVSILR